jgi:hypothetical protein
MQQEWQYARSIGCELDSVQHEFGKEGIQETEVQTWVRVFVEEATVYIRCNKWVHKKTVEG